MLMLFSRIAAADGATRRYGLTRVLTTVRRVFARLKVVRTKPATIRTITHAIRSCLEKTAQNEATKASSQKLQPVVRDAVDRHSLAFATS